MSAAAARGPIGQPRGIGFVIVMSIVTLGIYAIYWWYKTYQEVKNYRGQGVGGIGGVLLSLIIVGIFLLPAYVGRMYNEDGEQNPVSGLTGLWSLVPYVGGFILLYKCQSALNEFWGARGAPPPGQKSAAATS
jgi:hypothetical protein